jgi:RNA polymerase sigma-70 factor, ECF subfamily
VRQSLADQSSQCAAEIADDQRGRLERDWDLAEMVNTWPPKQQAVILLHYYQGMTLPSIGANIADIRKYAQEAHSRLVVWTTTEVLRFL